MPIITLLSDFGLRDPYVSEMKAVILSICPETHIVDITHDIEKFDIRMGAFVLASAASYFPEGTIHVAVVDPGVGTKRKPLVVESRRCLYVGPDNGLLMLAARREGIRRVFHITNPRYMLSKVSRTFHGRDVFAPAAAYLAKGISSSEFGPEVHDYVLPVFAKPQMSDHRILGEVLHIDGFGNIISNISLNDLERGNVHEGSLFDIKLGEKTLRLKLCSAYGEVPVGSPLAIMGSHGFLEISINQESASKFFGVQAGDPVQVFL